ncbi:YfiT family bacillithiol transferase [Paludisphaera borealis]|uniref:Metal-dependent hydrolase YfiT n=1 Tax=Paludisphaera borealis TaxID=1387353 RepID=A0A1U7CR37_9BACT|nr:putative metal-dependent hydrolase [Paludisphaera borealis]APW61405.1 Putative metal-dependent hydrolase YfiT [Paludisphaera borealis]
MNTPQFPVGGYVLESEPSRARRAEWIDELEKTPEEVRNAVAALSADQLDTKYRNWTVRQIVHHIADSHMQSYARFKWALTEDRPTIKPYDESRWAALADSVVGEVGASLALIDGLHARWVLLLRSLSDGDFQRTFHHPETGLSPRLDEVLGYYAWHARHHTGQIVWLRRNRGLGAVDNPNG